MWFTHITVWLHCVWTWMWFLSLILYSEFEMLTPFFRKALQQSCHIQVWDWVVNEGCVVIPCWCHLGSNKYQPSLISITSDQATIGLLIFANQSFGSYPCLMSIFFYQISSSGALESGQSCNLLHSQHLRMIRTVGTQVVCWKDGRMNGILFALLLPLWIKEETPNLFFG